MLAGLSLMVLNSCLKYGAKFVGRTILSISTTLPEIAIVAYAAVAGNYGIALGAGLGSNLLMMTLGLSVMLIIATTRLSKAPIKGHWCKHFQSRQDFSHYRELGIVHRRIQLPWWINIRWDVYYICNDCIVWNECEKEESLSASASNNKITKNNSENEIYVKIDRKGIGGIEPKAKTSTTSTAASKSESNLAEVREDLQHMAIRFDKQMLKVISWFGQTLR